MNINPNITRVLCFGDSNTWGRSGRSKKRYASNVRWTGILQEKLGSGYEVIEEGLMSRTTNLDDPDKPGRNGKKCLPVVLESHYPVDIVILWLGTNDLKEKYNRMPEEVVSALEELIEVIYSFSMNEACPKVLLVSPPLVEKKYLKPNTQFRGAHEKSRQLGPLIKQLAKRKQCQFIDLPKYVSAGKFDGVHLEPETQEKIADLFYRFID